MTPKRTPIYIESIALLPILDAGKGKSFETIDIRDHISKILREKRYSVSMANSFNDDRRPTADEVLEMDISELSTLGPENAKTFMLILEKTSYYAEHIGMGLVATLKIEATACLIDKNSQSMLWTDKGIGIGRGGPNSGFSVGDSGLSEQLGLPLYERIVLLPELRGLAMDACAKALLQTFPKQRK